MIISSSVFVAFCWIDNNNFRDGSSVLTRSCLHLHIPYMSIFTWVDLYNTTNTPISSDCVSISNVDYIVYSYVSFLCIPFLPGYQRWKGVSRPSFPKRVNNLLHELYSVSRIVRFLNGPCEIRLDALPNNMSFAVALFSGDLIVTFTARLSILYISPWIATGFSRNRRITPNRLFSKSGPFNQ